MSKPAPAKYASAYKERKSARRGMLAKIHALWRDLRPDLRDSRADSREGLLIFAEATLDLSHIGSLTDLTMPQLGRVIDALEKEHRQPALAGCEIVRNQPSVPNVGQTQADVVHLASREQVWVINRIFDYLCWTLQGRETFLRSKSRRTRPEMLLSKQAHGIIRVLMNIAASRDLKAERGQNVKVSQAAIRGYLPTLKRKLGIGQ